MAARSNGGTSTAAIAAAAITRPVASCRDTRSVLAVGTAASFTSASASSIGSVSRIGLIVFTDGASFMAAASEPSSAQFPDHMADLGQDQPCHGEADGRFGTRKREDGRPPDRAGAGAREHRRRADFLKAQHPEQLAEPV